MNLLLTGCFNYTEQQMDILRSLGFSVYFMQQEKDELPLPAAEIDAIVCNGLFLSHDIDSFKRLKFIQLTSAGFDRIPVDKIRTRNISLFNAKGVYSIPMAEWTIFRILEHYKKGWFFKKEQNNCRWTKNRDLREVTGIKVAIIGAGSVGQEVAKRFKVFGAATTGFDIHTNETEGFQHMRLTESLKEYVSEFDVIVVTAPLLQSTRGLISREILLKMKENAMLINISRGGLIDQKALIDIFSIRKDLFAALDVFEEEPLLSSSPLWLMDNVAISPHNSFVSNGNNMRMFNMIYTNLKNLIESK